MSDHTAKISQKNRKMFFSYLFMCICFVLVGLGVWLGTGSIHAQANWNNESETSVFEQDVQIDHIDFFLAVNEIDDYNVGVAFYIPLRSYTEYETEILEFYADALIRGEGTEFTSSRVVNDMQVVLFREYNLTQKEIEEFYAAIFMRSKVKSQVGDGSKYFSENNRVQLWTDSIDLTYYETEGVSPEYSVYCMSNIGRVYPLDALAADDAVSKGTLSDYELETYAYNDIYWDYKEVLRGERGIDLVNMSWIVDIAPSDESRGESKFIDSAFDYLLVTGSDPLQEELTEKEVNETEEEDISDKRPSDETDYMEEKEVGTNEAESSTQLVDMKEEAINLPQDNLSWIYIVISLIGGSIVLGTIVCCVITKKKKINKVKFVVFCPVCGELLKETDKACNKCGQNVKKN